jgi:HK97 gp10 family phage protein
MDVRFAPQEIRDLLNGDPMKQHMRDIAKAIQERAQAIAPVDSGDYRDSIKVGVAEQGDDGLEITVYSDDWKANFIEWGTTNNPAWAPLRRAADGTDGVTFTVSGR